MAPASLFAISPNVDAYAFVAFCIVKVLSELPVLYRCNLVLGVSVPIPK